MSSNVGFLFVFYLVDDIVVVVVVVVVTTSNTDWGFRFEEEERKGLVCVGGKR
jgi:hypothetical protein